MPFRKHVSLLAIEETITGGYVVGKSVMPLMGRPQVPFTVLGQYSTYYSGGFYTVGLLPLPMQ